MINEKDSTRNHKDIVVITDHQPLSDKLVSWLGDFYPQFSIHNGDLEYGDFCFLKVLKPALIILDTGLSGRKEKQIIDIIKSNSNSTGVIVLTYQDTGSYFNPFQKAGIPSRILNWENYSKLPFLMYSLLRKCTQTECKISQ